jgi:hypothetical protein
MLIKIMNNENEALAICSEFADEYGIDVEDGESLVVYTKSEYINELKNMLSKKGYKLKSFQVYGEESLINFIPNNRKETDDNI